MYFEGIKKSKWFIVRTQSKCELFEQVRISAISRVSHGPNRPKDKKKYLYEHTEIKRFLNSQLYLYTWNKKKMKLKVNRARSKHLLCKTTPKNINTPIHTYSQWHMKWVLFSFVSLRLLLKILECGFSEMIRHRLISFHFVWVLVLNSFW